MGAEQAWLLAAIPAGFFFVLAFFGRLLPRGGDYLGVLAILTPFVLFFFILGDFLDFFDAEAGRLAIAESIKWSDIGEFNLRMGTYVDPITITMFGV